LDFTPTSITCRHPHPDYTTYYLISCPKGDSTLEDALRIGTERARVVNPNNPSSVVRTAPQLLDTNCRGVLAEIASKKILEQEIANRMINATLEEGIAFENTAEGLSQVDLYLNFNENRHEIEIRSSCVRNGIEFGITNDYFTTLGWYITQNKEHETRKDFYVMCLFPFDTGETMTKFDNGLEFALVGGATKSILQGPLGSDYSLEQIGATYRGIRPICKGLDATQIINEIFS